MPYKEREIQKMFYSVGEVAQMFKVNTSHIRFWSKQFEVIKPATNKKGNRLFTANDIENFKVIYHLVKEKGFTLKGAKIEMAKMRKKMRLEGRQTLNIPTDQVVNEQEMSAALELFSELTPADDSIVDQMVLKNSLEKIKATLLQLSSELEMMEQR